MLIEIIRARAHAHENLIVPIAREIEFSILAANRPSVRRNFLRREQLLNVARESNVRLHDI